MLPIQFLGMLSVATFLIGILYGSVLYRAAKTVRIGGLTFSKVVWVSLYSIGIVCAGLALAFCLGFNNQRLSALAGVGFIYIVQVLVISKVFACLRPQAALVSLAALLFNVLFVYALAAVARTVLFLPVQ